VTAKRRHGVLFAEKEKKKKTDGTFVPPEEETVNNRRGEGPGGNARFRALEEYVTKGSKALEEDYDELSTCERRKKKLQTSA